MSEPQRPPSPRFFMPIFCALTLINKQRIPQVEVYCNFYSTQKYFRKKIRLNRL